MDGSKTDSVREYHRSNKRRSTLIITGTALTLIAIVIVTMMLGKYPLSFSEIVGMLTGAYYDDTDNYVLFETRIPRILCCVLVGAALSCAGLVMQSLFKNPMASPSVLGISNGAAFGASLAIAFGVGSVFGGFAVPVMAFIFCFITMILVYLLGRTRYGVSPVTLLLAGVAVGAFFNGMVSLMQYVVEDEVLASIVYWTMGSFNGCGWTSFWTAVIPITAGLVMMMFCRRELNLISAGETQASNLGVNVKRIRLVLIIATSLVVGGSVAISGVIGFVGLIVPHIFRMLAGSDHRLLMPLCILGGGAFMLVMDTISRMAFETALPVGVLTSLLGAPFFVYVMRKRSKDVWE